MDPERPAEADGQAPPGSAAEGKAAPAPTPSKEQLVSQLRDSIRRQRSWEIVSCLLILLVLTVPVALLVWWFWPRAEPPTLVVTAFDQVGVAGTTVVCRAQLETLDPFAGGFDLAGHAIIFNEIRFDGVKGDRAQVKVSTQAGGVAATDWPLPEGSARRLFSVRYVTPDRSRQTSDQARVYTWPKQTKVLLVDVAVLVQVGDRVWEQDAVRNLALQPGAVEALRSAREAKYAVAYLATGARRALTYRQVRNWFERSTAGPGGIPDGPVLGRLSVDGTESAAATPQAVLALLRRFDGPLVVLTAQAQTAKSYQAAGARVLMLGHGVTWETVAKELRK